MKKITSLVLGLVLIGATSFAQPVADRAVVPVAVTLNQILRLNVVNGGNIEFVFNNVADYKSGLTNSVGQYQTDFNVASSTPWSLLIWAEDASFIGNDDPGNTMSMSYVGFSITAGGVHSFDTEIGANNLVSASVNALANAATTLIGCSAIDGTSNCAGDVVDNSFSIIWQAGTGDGDMVQTSFIDAGLDPDRYTNNVFLDLITSGI